MIEASCLEYTYVWGRPTESSELYVMLTYISWSSDLTLYLLHYFLVLHHALDISSIWQYKWSLNTSRSVWPIFHGPVILLNISNTIGWIYIILGILVQYDTVGDIIILVAFRLLWCIFHGPVILLNISNTVLWIYIIFKILVQYDTMSELKVLICQCDLYFMVQWC